MDQRAKCGAIQQLKSFSDSALSMYINQNAHLIELILKYYS